MAKELLPSQKARLIESQKAIDALPENLKKHFKVDPQWQKVSIKPVLTSLNQIKCISTDHECVAATLDDYLKKNEAKLLKLNDMDFFSVALKPVKNPFAISGYLKEDKENTKFLYCTLTKKQIKNSHIDAHKHVDGAYFRHKFYEMFRQKCIKKKREWK